MHEPRRPAWRELAARCSILWIASLFACSSEVPLSVVLVTVDTLRADALDPYHPGDSRHGRTPRISLLAADSTLFERAFAPMPLTRPSHFSIMTGRYPREHGVMNNEIALPDDALTLAEILRDRGYHTGAVVGTPSHALWDS